jgi:hypothetical protein
MDGFKSLPKMQCFKEGGSVKNKMPAFLKKETKSEVKMDKAQDKSMVKKGVKQHESALHKGEPKTELKLKTGGRAKKATGTVKKFEKASGEYGAKKTAADKKNIKEAKQFKPAFKNGGKACAPSAAKKAKMCGGKSVKKMQTGGAVDVKDPQALVDKIALEENTADANIIPNALKAVKRVGKKVIKSAKDMFGGQGAVSDADKSNIAKKKGGKVKKCNEGGSLKETDAKENPGLAQLPTNVRNKMGYMRNGGKAKVKKYAEGGAVLSDEEKNWLGGADATDPYILARMRSALGDKKPVAKPPAAAVAPAVEPMMDKPYQAPNVEQDSGLAYPQENEIRTAPMAQRPVRRPVRPARPAPYQAPNVEQDSGLAYPQENEMRTGPMAPPPVRKPGFFSATPGQQADQFRRSAEQRKKVGMKIGNTLGLNKPPVN